MTKIDTDENSPLLKVVEITSVNYTTKWDDGQYHVYIDINGKIGECDFSLRSDEGTFAYVKKAPKSLSELMREFKRADLRVTCDPYDTKSSVHNTAKKMSYLTGQDGLRERFESMLLSNKDTDELKDLVLTKLFTDSDKKGEVENLLNRIVTRFDQLPKKEPEDHAVLEKPRKGLFASLFGRK